MPRDAFVLKIQRELCHPKYAQKVSGLSRNGPQGPVSRKPRQLFGPEKPFGKLWPAYAVNLVFSYVVKGIKIKITAKFRASGRLRFEDTKRILSPEMRPKSFGTFEKQAPGARFSKVPKFFGWHNSLCIFKTKVFGVTKLCSYFNLHSLYKIWKDQLHRISASEFYEWLFVPVKFSGLLRNARQVQ